MNTAAHVTWLILRISRWLLWLGFFAYCFYVNYFWADLVNQFGHLPFYVEVLIFGLANAAVFAGLLEMMMRGLRVSKEALINAAMRPFAASRRTFFLSKPPAHSGRRERMAWCRQADGSVLRARYRFASANSENTCAPFLAMPR